MHKFVKGPSRKSRFEESGDAIHAEARSAKSSGAGVISILSRASNTWPGQADNVAFKGSVPSVSDRTPLGKEIRTSILSAQIVKIEEVRKSVGRQGQWAQRGYKLHSERILLSAVNV
jgi:hypothetical protein